MYHSISNDPEAERRPYWQVTTTPAQFRRQMSCLREVGCEVVSMRDALETRATATARMRPRVVITFDDGYLDFMTDAFPVLDEFGFPATVFLPTEFIGDRPREFKGRRCLTWGQVRELQGRGVTFGSHTVSHPQLHDVDDEQLKHELRASKEEIEQRTGVGVEFVLLSLRVSGARSGVLPAPEGGAAALWIRGGRVDHRRYAERDGRRALVAEVAGQRAGRRSIAAREG